jgi:hypothetical protein
MKLFFRGMTRFFSSFSAVLALTAIWTGVQSHAMTVNLHMDVTQDNNPGGIRFYYAYPYFEIDPPSNTTNAIISPTGDSFHVIGANNSLVTLSGGGTTSMETLISRLTNGLWTLVLNSNTPAQMEYKFSVAVSNLNSATWPVVVIHQPESEATEVVGRPEYHWSGPTNWSDIQANVRSPDFSYYYSGVLDFDATNWSAAPSLPSGDKQLEINYELFDAPMFQIATPTNTSGSLTGWVSAVKLLSYRVHHFNVASVPDAGHVLRAHYRFDETNMDGTISGVDESGNGNDINSSLGWGTPAHQFSEDAAAGPGAARFFGFTALVPPTNLLSAFSGAYSVSVWVKTTQVAGNDNDSGIVGPGIVYAETFEGQNDSVPIALTGGKAAFWTGNAGAGDNTLHSTSNINSGEYVHIVVTRSQETGEKKIYINGEPDSSGFGTTANLLDAYEELSLLIGGNKNNVGFNGFIDDVQIYTGVLSAVEVGFLYTNPGETVDNVSSVTLPQALDTFELEWTTGGDGEWVAQTTIAADEEDAATSPILDEEQVSWMQTVVPYDGEVSFQWKVSSLEDSDFLSFYINDVEKTFLSGEIDWVASPTFGVTAGDVLRWEYSKDLAGSAGADRGWVDMVDYAPDLSTVYMNMRLRIQRGRNAAGDFGFFALPFIQSHYPSPQSNHRIESPGGAFSGDVNGSGAIIFSSLESLIEECTNGQWSLWFNKDTIAERFYTFQVTINGLDTNVLGPVTIFSPANDATNVTTTPVFHWNGPANFPSVFLKVFQPGLGGESSLTLPGTATNWPSPPTLSPDTNRFEVEYSSNDFAGVTFTTPVNLAMEPLAGWLANADLRSGAASVFTVQGVPPVQPAQITNVVRTPGNIGFGFNTSNGPIYRIQARTNLIIGTWLELTNFPGDGTLKQFTFPTTNPPVRFFRVVME